MKSEEAIQKDLVTYLNILKHKIPDLIFFAVPNGGLRNLRVAQKLKATGVVKGVPDLFIATPRKDYHGLFIELKSEKGRKSPEQKDMIKKLNNNNYKAEFCFGLISAIKTINEYLNESKRV